MVNRLVAARSLYLHQHADNPVDWYPWGDEAFARAEDEDKPIFLSIGYSACHWCHVMARESFASAHVAAILNEHFICIKVDREERPDVDAAYMEAVQAMTGHGGWPLSVFVAPDGTPFYGGTYYPPSPRAGMPGFPQVLVAIADAWAHRRSEVLTAGHNLVAALSSAARQAAPGGDGPGIEAVEAAVDALVARADRLHGGLGDAPKFPQAPALAFLMSRHARSPGGDLAALEVALAALAGMIRGGIHDQLAGGFHRYSVDAAWTVPHFEKMLYDNAQLALLCLQAWQLTGVARFRQAAESTLDFLLCDLRGDHGGFLAAIDADSEGEEGAHYLWSPSEVEAAVDRGPAAVAQAWFGVTAAGNFEGRTVLTARGDPAATAAAIGMSDQEFRAACRRARTELLAARRRRPAPRVDPKVVVSWNALAITAMARGGAVLQRGDLVTAAVGAADLVRREAQVAGGLAHSWTADGAEVPAFLEDSAGMALACYSLYEATFDASWLAWAEELLHGLLADHGDGPGALARTTRRHGALFLRQQELVDGPVPSGNALAAAALLRLAALKGDAHLEARAAAIVGGAGNLAGRVPEAVPGLMEVLDTILAGSLEVVVVGAAANPTTGAMVETAWGAFLPGALRVVAGDGWRWPATPLLEGRMTEPRPAAYVCRGGRCGLPAYGPEDLAARLPAPAPRQWDGRLAADPTRSTPVSPGRR